VILVENNNFLSGSIMIGGKEVPFAHRPIQGGYTMALPQSFFEDENLVSQYTYLFSKDKSPLSIAIKFTPVMEEESRQKKIRHYFSQAKDGQPPQKIEPGITYRETVTGGTYMSIYSLRFAVETAAGILFGCFNCAADYREDWQTCVLQMLQSIAPA
jgi:hypothetical protein